MNKIQNLKLMLKDRQYLLSFYSLCSAACSRTKMDSLYKLFSERRYQICRKIIQNKIKFQDDKLKVQNCNLEYTDVIWTMWYQGIENAPVLIKDAIKSKYLHSNGHKVIVIDKNNIEEFVTVPDFVKNKVSSGTISLAHLSDYVRSFLLYKYGGLWLDSTLFVVDKIPENIFDKEFWSIHWDTNRGWIASYDKWSVGVMASKPNSRIMEYCAKMEYSYWKTMDYPVTYLLLDMFIALFYENDLDFRKIIDSTENNNSHIFDFVESKAYKGNLPVDEVEYSNIRRDTWMFKLTYKEHYTSELKGQKTFFGTILDESLKYDD